MNDKQTTRTSKGKRKWMINKPQELLKVRGNEW